MSLITILFAAAIVGQPDISCSSEYLQRQLDDRSSADQSARRLIGNNTFDDKVLMHVLEVDADNRRWFQLVLEKCGWPKKSMIGENSSTNAWLLAQHADAAPGFQEYAAAKMKIAVVAGEANSKLLALLVDRNRRIQKQPQVYGMQFNVQENARLVFLPIEAPVLLNKRRKEIGLEPFVCHVDAVTREKKLPAIWPEGVLYEPAHCHEQ
ncbi:MAG: hypothetical protein JNN20_12985 [Betaproteobacteria bacterium]|nr:hypothetical protein [Betaproteobacteria bacterium]